MNEDIKQTLVIAISAVLLLIWMVLANIGEPPAESGIMPLVKPAPEMEKAVITEVKGDSEEQKALPEETEEVPETVMKKVEPEETEIEAEELEILLLNDMASEKNGREHIVFVENR